MMSGSVEAWHLQGEQNQEGNFSLITCKWAEIWKNVEYLGVRKRAEVLCPLRNIFHFLE